MSHANARLTEYGRMLLIDRLEQGWTQAEAAKAQGISRSTVSKWWRRYNEDKDAGLKDRSSAPQRLPHALAESVVEAICRLRRELGAGPHRIAYELGMAASTVYSVLRRKGLAVLAHLDRTTRAVIRYERERPGELVHLDVKKLGRIPDGGGKRFDEGFHESGSGRSRPGPKRGHDYVHVAVDDHSRFAYAEALPDEKGATTAGFLQRAVHAFALAGVTVEGVLTDNAWNYRRSDAFRDTLSALAITACRTRPYHPQTNGKAEAFNKRLQREWAYRRHYASNEARLAALQPFIDDYNYVRPHTAVGNRPPASRLLTT